MRTTLTLDDDVALLLREQAERQGMPFKQVVNRVIRLGLRADAPPPQAQAYQVRPHSFGFKPGIDQDKLNQLVDELEADHYRERILRHQEGAHNAGPTARRKRS